jgi:hypothetical protein
MQGSYLSHSPLKNANDLNNQDNSEGSDGRRRCSEDPQYVTYFETAVSLIPMLEC